MTSVSTKQDLGLMAHLLRRAGFGTSREELEQFTRKGYEATVEELLNPLVSKAMPNDLIRRYHVDQAELRGLEAGGAYWLFKMATTTDPLSEKIALLWHRVFATGWAKTGFTYALLSQIDMFRKVGMGNFAQLLLEVAKDPSMILWLDNQDNHKTSINENFGREILELFSMGAGNYTEQDIKECSRAFTGWSVLNTDYMVRRMEGNSPWPYNRIGWLFEYKEEDHDDGEKTFLGETGRFNGDDIVNIICKQPATARYIARHIYHFFVADEPPVPHWPLTPPKDPEAIKILADAYFRYGYNIKSMLRVLFNSDFFKAESVRLARVKSPVELVAGTLRLAGGFDYPEVTQPFIHDTQPLLGQELLNNRFRVTAEACINMGQWLLNPPGVEGWYGGSDWVNTGAMVERVNFAADKFSDKNRPGVQAIINSIKTSAFESPLSPESLVNYCLDSLSMFEVSEATHAGLVEYAKTLGSLEFGRGSGDGITEDAIMSMLQLIVTSREYQLV